VGKVRKDHGSDVGLAGDHDAQGVERVRRVVATTVDEHAPQVEPLEPDGGRLVSSFAPAGWQEENAREPTSARWARCCCPGVVGTLR
jgi:hypothetical protein